MVAAIHAGTKVSARNITDRPDATLWRGKIAAVAAGCVTEYYAAALNADRINRACVKWFGPEGLYPAPKVLAQDNLVKKLWAGKVALKGIDLQAQYLRDALDPKQVLSATEKYFTIE